MKQIAKFEIVSYEQFASGCLSHTTLTNEQIKYAYEHLKLPKRATTGSAGYDFFLPYPLILKPNETITIPTGIRAWMENGWVLQLFPRSSLGFKYRLQLNNTVGIIDADYYYAENEGHIFAKITNASNEDKTLYLNQMDGFMQGVFMEFGITVDDHCDNIRTGGIGSTNK